MPNPWMILGAVGLTIALTIGGYFYGVNVTNTSRDASDLKARVIATDAARATEHAWQAKLDATQAKLEQEKQDAKNRESKLRADIDAGARQLRIAVVNERRAADSQSAAGSDVENVELAPAARRAYFQLRQSIIENRQALDSCQGYVVAIGGAN